MVGMSEHWLPGGFGFHSHDRHQLIYASRGVVHVHLEVATWVLPVSRALWIHAGARHSITVKRPAEIKLLYVDAQAYSLPTSSECFIVEVSPLLRELINECALHDYAYAEDSTECRLAQVLLDQAAPSVSTQTALQLPVDRRALKVAELLGEEPGNRESAEELASRVGASARTLMRLFLDETRMSLGTWRLRKRMLLAVELLAYGESVTEVAQQVGYESTSSFVAAFGSMFGVTPAKYFR